MKIRDLYRPGRQAFSFEFFPPKTEDGETRLFETIAQLKALQPSFVSVTYGAMGTTRENTLRIVSRIQNEIGIEAAAHLTCVGHTKEEIVKVLGELKRHGIENIVALRGDPPQGAAEFRPVDGGFRYAAEMVRFIRQNLALSESFSLAVAGYPEGHLECKDKQKDLEHLKAKVDAGGDAVITQLFFDNRDYFDFVQRARKVGIQKPIVPGIMPVTHGPQIQKFAQMCGARIPEIMRETIQRYGEDQKAVEAYGIEYATRQCEELLRNDVPGLHFYTLNKSNATRQIHANLGLIRK